ncbi:MAG: prolipoprotein diacylglyceryl transferase [Patescibacteria group bacterium]|nr:prolipoprotein diacylglyceryl transferase [Patescibacteria group bacterium]
MFTNNISPVLLEIGPIEIRYYGLFFALGAVIYYFVTRGIFKREKLPTKDFEDLIVFLFVGLIIGARFGHIVFYNFAYYFEHPMQVFKVWQGGLSSHGAAIGLLTAYLIFRFWRNPDKKCVDMIVIAMPITAGFVRLGNFFNSEIIGRETDLPWGVVFARNGESFARHPSQLYEMILLWGIFAVMFFLYKRRERPTYFFVMFFVLFYFAGRFFLEFFKEYMVFGEGLTMGQWLSLGFVSVTGLTVLAKRFRIAP